MRKRIMLLALTMLTVFVLSTIAAGNAWAPKRWGVNPNQPSVTAYR